MPEDQIRIVDRFGRVTIPVDLRREFGFQPGTVVVYRAIKNGIFVQTKRAHRQKKKQRRR